MTWLIYSIYTNRVILYWSFICYKQLTNSLIFSPRWIQMLFFTWKSQEAREFRKSVEQALYAFIQAWTFSHSIHIKPQYLLFWHNIELQLVGFISDKMKLMHLTEMHHIFSSITRSSTLFKPCYFWLSKVLLQGTRGRIIAKHSSRKMICQFIVYITLGTFSPEKNLHSPGLDRRLASFCSKVLGIY